MPRDVASRNALEQINAGKGVGPKKNGVYLDFRDAINRVGRDAIEERYGNLFEMYERITGENPYEVPMRIYPAPHYTMGGLWVDYHLQTTVEGLYAIGEANFSDHGANRLGASALMQGLADGYFVLPYTIGDFLADKLNEEKITTDHEAFQQAEQAVQERITKLLSVNGTRTVDWFHRELGKIMIEYCGLARSRDGLQKAIGEIQQLREEFWNDVRVLGSADTLNSSLEKAGRVADFFELAELMCIDALDREESCGGHFRVESQTDEGEALRDDENYSYSAAWFKDGEDENSWTLEKEPLEFNYVKLTQRSYK